MEQTSSTILDAGDAGELARVFFEESNDAILVFDPSELRVCDANPAALRSTRLSRSVLLDQRVDELLSSNRPDALRELIEACQTPRGFHSGEPYFLNRHGAGPLLVNARISRLPGERTVLGLLVLREFNQGTHADDEPVCPQPAIFDPLIRDQVLESATNAILITDACWPDHPIVYCNPAFEDMTGYSRNETLGRNGRFLQREDNDQPGVQLLRQAVAAGQECTATVRNYRKDGTPFWNEVRVSPIRDAEGQLTHFLGINHDVTQRRRMQAFLEGDVRVLRLLAQNADLNDILHALVITIEAQTEGWIGSVLVVDEVASCLHIGAAPGLPSEYNDAVAGLPVGPGVGVCGTAAYRRERVVVRDTYTDPLCADYREVFRRFQLRACWSQPIQSSTGDILGTFAMYDLEPREPTEAEIQLIEHAAQLAGISIERKNAEKQLRESQTALRNAQHRAQLGSWEFHPEGGETNWSEEMYRLCHRDPGDGPPAAAEEYAELVHPDDRELILRMVELVRSTQEVVGSLDVRTNPAAGPLRWLNASVHRVENDRKDGFYAAGTVMDITDRKLTELALQESQDRFRTLVENAPEAIVVLDTDGRRFIDVNDRAMRLFRLNREQLSRMGPADVSPVKQPNGRLSAEASKESIQQALEGEKPIFEWVHCDSAGREIPCEVRLVRLPSSKGQLVRGSITDISERKRAEEQLRASEERLHNQYVELEHVYRTAPVGLCLLDAQLRFVRINDKLAAINGRPAEEHIGKHIREMLPDIVDEIEPVYDRVLKTGEPVLEFEVARPSLDGSGPEQFFEVSYHPLKDPHGLVMGIGTMVQDVTARKLAETQQRRHQHELAHVARLSTMGEMVAGIAHELNQPLFSIANYSDACLGVLQRGTPDQIAHVREWAEEIRKQSTRAGEIMKRLADFVRHDTQPRRQLLDINALIREAIDLVSFEARARGVKVFRELLGRNCLVHVDGVQIQQVAVNLLRNAFDALQDIDQAERQVTVRTFVSGGVVETEIIDNGPGFSDETADKLFKTFFTTKQHGMGMGMGLAISRSIINTHGGELRAYRNQWGGATFTFRLNLHPGDDDQP